MMRRWPNLMKFVRVSIVALVVLAILGSHWALAQENEAIEGVKKRRFIRFCVDQWNLPLSDNDPITPGSDVEFTALIARKLGVRARYHWTNTNVGGVRGAMAESILLNKCDCFVGLPTWATLKEEMAERGLVLTRPYYGTGFVLVVKKEDNTTRVLEDLKGKKIGVVMGKVADWYLFKNNYDRVLYRRPTEVLQAMTDGEVDSALMWAPLSGWHMLQEGGSYDAKLVEGYVPIPDLRLDVAMAVRAEDEDLRKALDWAIGELATAGELERIFGNYGIPYYPPFQEPE